MKFGSWTYDGFQVSFQTVVVLLLNFIMAAKISAGKYFEAA
jgi:hypothetical protein